MEHIKNQVQIVNAVILAGVIIAFAILLRGSTQPIAKAPKGPTVSSPAFNQCLDSGKYLSAVKASTDEAHVSGVSSTPQSFIIKDGKVIDKINGAQPLNIVTTQITQAINSPGSTLTGVSITPVTDKDFMLGNKNASVTIVEYADFQCPFCGKFFNEIEGPLFNDLIKQGKINLVYRDFTFLGKYVQPYVPANDESIHAALAARCAADQGKFWEYHDYLYTHQAGENQGGFSIPNLKSFANALGLE